MTEKYFFIDNKKHQEFYKATNDENTKVSLTYRNDKIWVAKIEKMTAYDKEKFYVNPNAIDNCTKERFNQAVEEAVDFLLLSLKTKSGECLRLLQTN